MSQFTEWSTLDLRWRQQHDRWAVLTDIVWEVDHLGSGERVIVPAGFLTDLASVPRGLWPIVAPFGDHGQAAVLHDWLYHQCDQRGRKWADRQFLEAMAALGVGLVKRRVMWSAVRAFGWRRWLQACRA